MIYGNLILLGAREGVNGKIGVNPTRSRHCNNAEAFKSGACLCVKAVSTSDGDGKRAVSFKDKYALVSL